MEWTKFQHRVLLVPEPFDLFLGGGRGGAKSYTLAALAMRHAEQYGKQARILYLRQTYGGLSDFESMTRILFGEVYGRAAKYNAGKHIWRIPGGATLELGQLENESDYGKYHGRSFTLLLIDEATQYATPALLDRLRSNLRGPEDMPLRVALAANPGGVGHQWVAQRFVFGNTPWQPFFETNSKTQWVHAPSTFLDNPYIDRDAYKRQLEASAPGDPELLRAWLQGDWHVARGAFFSGVLDEQRNMIDGKITQFDDLKLFETTLAHDYGSSAPSVTYLMLRSPGFRAHNGIYYPNDSLLVIDELATYAPENLNEGLGWTIPRLSEEIRAFAKQYNVRPKGVADDAIFGFHGHATGSIAHEFAACGVRWKKARKADRQSGWAKMRRLLADAGKPDRPGLYIHRRCEYFWATVPFLARDPKRPEDLDSRSADHGADAIRYGCLRKDERIRTEELVL